MKTEFKLEREYYNIIMPILVYGSDRVINVGAAAEYFIAGFRGSVTTSTMSLNDFSRPDVFQHDESDNNNYITIWCYTVIIVILSTLSQIFAPLS